MYICYINDFCAHIIFAINNYRYMATKNTLDVTVFKMTRFFLRHNEHRVMTKNISIFQFLSVYSGINNSFSVVWTLTNNSQHQVLSKAYIRHSK